MDAVLERLKHILFKEDGCELHWGACGYVVVVGSGGEGGVLVLVLVLVGRGGTHFMHNRSRMTIWYRPSHPHYAEAEHVGFPPTTQTSRAPRVKRRDVFDESLEGWFSSH